jgi:LysM repeat protein
MTHTQPAPPVRLTTMGRAVVVALLVVAALTLFSVAQLAARAVAADPAEPASSISTTEWVVQPGETLWEVAQTVDPGSDPRDTVARLVELNDLSSSSVVAGQTLIIPA